MHRAETSGSLGLLSPNGLRRGLNVAFCEQDQVLEVWPSPVGNCGALLASSTLRGLLHKSVLDKSGLLKKVN